MMRARSVLVLVTGLLVVAAMVPATAAAAEAFPNPDYSGPLYPEELTPFGCWLYFSAEDPDVGRELHRTNGVVTEVVADINPGPDGSDPEWLTVFDDFVYFSAYEPATGRELWRSDGTDTELVANISYSPAPGDPEPSSDPDQFTEFGDWLYFSAGLFPASGGRGLHRTKGTVTETVPMGGVYGKTAPQELTPMGGWLYYSAYWGLGRELQRTNGVIVETVGGDQPGPIAYPEYLTPMGGWLYFAASFGLWDQPPVAGRELYRTDGTVIELVADINPGPESSTPEEITVLGDFVYFSAYEPTTERELWRSNGTVTEQVANLAYFPGVGDWSSDPYGFTALGEWLYFGAEFLIDSPRGAALHRTNGTVTEMVPLAGYDRSNPAELTPMGDWLYYRAWWGLGFELQRTNGVTTETVGGPQPGPIGSPTDLTPMGGWLYFAGFPGYDGPPRPGAELHRTDGTTIEIVPGVREAANDLLDLEGRETSYDSTPVPGGAAGVFTITATFSNASPHEISKPYFEVTQLTGGHLVLNAACGAGRAGALVAVPDEALGLDGILSPGESFVVEFEIGLRRQRPFKFLVDAFAIVR